ncbi:hypothetical protein BJV82DRAFT_609663 [Fennellomyces sp. T-0311]|nr:hypothetical protein BJV82DRAFT_609663 [Fennellomyces sp. T-0311]
MTIENFLTTTIINQPSLRPVDNIRIQLKVTRSLYRQWIQLQETHYSVKFLNRTKSRNHRRVKNEEPSTKRSRGMPRHIFNKQYVCKHAGNPRGNNSMYCNFQARFVDFMTMECRDKDMINIDYYREHTGHVPGSNQDIISGTFPRSVTMFIQEKVEKNLTWRNIKHMLHLNKEVLTRILDTEHYSSIPLAIQVNYDHVYPSSRTILFGPSMEASLEKWGEKVRQESGHFMAKNLEMHEQGMFFVAFMSDWQLEVSKNNGHVSSLESTHKTCVDANSKNCYFYTIVSRWSTTRKGKPLAWMITTSQDQYRIKFWLDQHGFVLERVMVDDSVTEICCY